jgi:hypothetical protein
MDVLRLLLLDANHHRVGTNEVLDASLVEARLFHPADAIRAGVVEAASSLDEHIQAHHQAESIRGAIVIDDALVDDDGSPSWKCFKGLSDEKPLLFEIPVMQDVAHHDNVRIRNGRIPEAARMEAEAVGEPIVGNVVFEDRRHLGEIEPDACDVRVSESDLCDEVALCRTDINGRFVFGPGKLLCDRDIGAATDTGHGTQKSTQASGIRVQGSEGIISALGAGFVLRFTRAEGGGEVAPVTVESIVGHFEDASHVGSLTLVEEEIGGGGVVVGAVAPLEEAESQKSIEEVSRRPGMESEAGAQLGQSLGMFGQFGEKFKFDSAEQDLGGPKAGAHLQDLVWPWFSHNNARSPLMC